VVDPYANPSEVQHEYGYTLAGAPTGKYDAVIVAVAHKDYAGLKEGDFASLLNDQGILVDIKGMYRKIIRKITYWSL
jgi:UDP-N-acetyl-D-galactosamine dehydrogenase